MLGTTLVLVRGSRHPLLDTCRVLIAAGADPKATVIMRHVGSDVDCLRARFGIAARLTVKEPDRGRIRFCPWSALSSCPVRPPIAPNGNPVPGCPDEDEALHGDDSELVSKVGEAA